MNRKVLLLVLIAALLFVAVGVVSAAGNWNDVIQMEVDTSLEVHCQGGYILTDVSNNNYESVAYLACVNIYPPR